MSRLISRWRWLTIFALANFVCWVGVAIAVGLAASPELDLGVETLVREARATAVIAWKQASVGPAEPTSRPAPTDKVPHPVPTEAVAAQEPTPAVVWPDTPTPSPVALVQATGQVQQNPSPSPTAESRPAPTETPVRRPLLLANPPLKDLAQVDAEMARSAVGRPVQIRYSEADLNLAIAALVENNPKLPYENVKVVLLRDRVVVTGSATVLSFPVSTEVIGAIQAEDCLPHIEIQSISIAGVMTPCFVKDQIEEMILEAETWYPPDYPLCLEQIIVENGRATVYGHRR